jgi:glycosyltransferase involved in cell wall biosynthesis
MHICIIHYNVDYLPLTPYNIGLHLSNRGYTVSLLLPGDRLATAFRTKPINERFTIYFCPTLLWGVFIKGLDPLDLLTKIVLINRLPCDLVFLIDSRPSVVLPGLFAKLSKRIPMIILWTDWYGRGGIISDRSGRLYRFFFEGIETFFEEYFRRFADSYAVTVPTLGERLRSLGYARRIVLLPVACNAAARRDYDVKALRKRLQLPEEARLIGCVGSLCSSDANLAFKSVSLLRETTDATLVLIGNNIYRNRYRIPEHAIETRKLSQQQLYDYIGACDVMLIPFRNSIANNGRWPSKLSDYLVMGKPVVATNICVVRELFKVAKFGEIAEDKPADFARKLRGLLENADELKKYSGNAYQLASGLLSWNAIIDTADGLITDTLRSYHEETKDQ